MSKLLTAEENRAKTATAHEARYKTVLYHATLAIDSAVDKGESSTFIGKPYDHDVVAFNISLMVNKELERLGYVVKDDEIRYEVSWRCCEEINE